MGTGLAAALDSDSSSRFENCKSVYEHARDYTEHAIDRTTFAEVDDVDSEELYQRICTEWDARSSTSAEDFLEKGCVEDSEEPLGTVGISSIEDAKITKRSPTDNQKDCGAIESRQS